MSDIREIYQAKQTANKIKKMTPNESKNRDEDDTKTQIRSFPLAASTSPEKSSKPLPITKSKS